MPRSTRKPAPMKVKKGVPADRPSQGVMFEENRPLQFAVMEDIAKDKKVKEKDVFENPNKSGGVKGVKVPSGKKDKKKRGKR